MRSDFCASATWGPTAIGAAPARNARRVIAGLSVGHRNWERAMGRAHGATLTAQKDRRTIRFSTTVPSGLSARERSPAMRPSTRLRQMLKEPGIIVAPGAYDGFSARLIEAAGFRCVYMTGAGTAASHLGQPDLGLATLTEMANHAGHLASCVSLPVIADADTGYGNVLNVVRTVREYERAGVAGLHVEDQVAPKKCGHIAGKQIIPTQEFCDKIRAAAEYRTDPDFVIIARTDARAATSLDDDIVRRNRAAEAGAEVIFVEGPQTLDEVQRVPREGKGAVRANRR